jgi:acyl carrier protein
VITHLACAKNRELEMNDRVLNILEARLKAMFPEKAALLDGVDVGQVDFNTLGFDSLDTLQFAMDMEEALNIEIAAVDFSGVSTLATLADSLAVLVAQQRASSRTTLA